MGWISVVVVAFLMWLGYFLFGGKKGHRMLQWNGHGFTWNPDKSPWIGKKKSA
jgi:hypothetical protein